jgi:hypothetical protein
MSDAVKPEQHPFEKLKQITRQILAVPKKEIDRRDAEWREQRKAEKKSGNHVHTPS